MADINTGKKKVYSSKSEGNAGISDKKETNVGVPPGKFTKRFRGTKAKIATNCPNMEEDW